MSIVSENLKRVLRVTGGNPNAVDGNAEAWKNPQGSMRPLPPVPTKPNECKCDEPSGQLPETDSRGVRYEGDRMVSATGAVRSSDAQHERYDLIGTTGLRRLAETYAEGAKKYTDDNWLKGFPVSDLLNHTIRHLVLYRSGDNSEDHLAHAAFGLFAMMHFEEQNPECVDVKSRIEDGSVKQYPRWWEQNTGK